MTFDPESPTGYTKAGTGLFQNSWNTFFQAWYPPAKATIKKNQWLEDEISFLDMFFFEKIKRQPRYIIFMDATLAFIKTLLKAMHVVSRW